MENILFLHLSCRVNTETAQDAEDQELCPEITGNDRAEGEEVPAEQALAADLQEEAAETQQAVPVEEETEDPSESEAASTEEDSDLESREQTFARQEAYRKSLEETLARQEAEPERREKASAQQESLRHAPATEQPAPKVSAVDILKEMKELSGRTRELSKMVQDWNEDGLRALCHLSQDMNHEEELLPWAGRLDHVLENFFQAEAIEPRAGDGFDPSLHTRLSYSRTGRKVKACLAKGWRRGSITLAHAVVDTD